MTRNIPVISEQKLRQIMEEKRRLKVEKDALTALCISLISILGMVLILF